MVILNAYAFFDEKAGGFKANLDQVRNFIGKNFKTHKKAFTFLFTKCTGAFSGIATEDLMNLKSEERLLVLRKARDQLKTKLEEVDLAEGTPENLRYLMQLLVYYIEKENHFCEILDPIISDVSSIRERLEPAFPQQHFLKGSDYIVRVNLALDSRTLLEKELERRKKNLKLKLENNLHVDLSEETKKMVLEESLVLCKVARFIDFEKCRETAIETLEFLTKVYSKKNSEISEALVNVNAINGRSAERARVNIGQFNPW